MTCTCPKPTETDGAGYCLTCRRRIASTLGRHGQKRPSTTADPASVASGSVRVPALSILHALKRSRAVRRPCVASDGIRDIGWRTGQKLGLTLGDPRSTFAPFPRQTFWGEGGRFRLYRAKFAACIARWLKTVLSSGRAASTGQSLVVKYGVVG